jgi:hypothetical protein
MSGLLIFGWIALIIVSYIGVQFFLKSTDML